MGKLKALKLGIVKGIQHTLTYGQQTTLEKAIDYTVSKMKCTNCGHASRAHNKRRASYASLDGQDLFKLLKETFDKTLPGFDECTFYYCDDCKSEYLACEGHHDNDSCNGKHDEVQRQSELKGCSA